MKTIKETVYRLTDVDLSTMTGTLKVRDNKKGAKWTSFVVSISMELALRIMNNYHRGLNPGDSFVDTNFVSTVDSTEFSDNPLKLLHFKPSKNSDVPENFHVCLVFEKQSMIETVSDALGRRIDRWKRQSFKAKQYMRFMEINFDKTIDQLKHLVISEKDGQAVCHLGYQLEAVNKRASN